MCFLKVFFRKPSAAFDRHSVDGVIIHKTHFMQLHCIGLALSYQQISLPKISLMFQIIFQLITERARFLHITRA